MFVIVDNSWLNHLTTHYYTKPKSVGGGSSKQPAGVGHINLQGVQQWQVRVHRPLSGGVGAVEGVFKLDDGAVLVLQDAVLSRVVLHQLWQGGKLLSAIQVVEVSCVLDPDVGHQLAHPEEIKQSDHTDRQRFSSTKKTSWWQ